MVMVLVGLLAGTVLAVDNLVISDPMYIGVGARPLGMGKAFVAMAEDADGIFVNPAGLGSIYSPKITSMYANVLGDVNYMVLGGAYPHTENSAIGAGIIRSAVDGIELRDSLGNLLPGSGSWGSSVFFLGYGVNMPNAKMQVGGNLKYFSQGGAGTSTIESASATGLGFDLGAIYRPNENIAFGLCAQNPFSTKLESGNGVENMIKSVIKAGAKVSMAPRSGQLLNLALDVDLAKSRPTTYHVGAEYRPISPIAFRLGVDQDPAPEGTVSNLTAGLGLRISGVEFNYAYHPYSGIDENTTHYFSIAYVGPEKEEEEASLDLTLITPTDKSIIYADHVEVAGSVKGRTVFPVKVNGVSVPIAPDGKFTTTVPVDKVGKKLILVEAEDKDKKTVRLSRRLIRLVQFSDVKSGYWAKKPIEHTGTVGLVQGYPDGAFKPERELSRAELATLLVRAKGVTPYGKPRQVFLDVKISHWAAGYIEAATRMGLVKGYPDGKFRPDNRITKAESIAVLARFDKLPLEVAETRPYLDVKTSHWAAKYIQAAKETGMLTYISGPRLRPKEQVTRAEAIEMMSHTSMASKMINDLLSWDRGFEFEMTRPTIRAGL